MSKVADKNGNPQNVKKSFRTLLTAPELERDGDPDFIGDIIIDGIKYQVGAWILKDKNGYENLSISLREHIRQN
jgi:hypothetical protein